MGHQPQLQIDNPFVFWHYHSTIFRGQKSFCVSTSNYVSRQDSAVSHIIISCHGWLLRGSPQNLHYVQLAIVSLCPLNINFFKA